MGFQMRVVVPHQRGNAIVLLESGGIQAFGQTSRTLIKIRPRVAMDGVSGNA